MKTRNLKLRVAVLAAMLGAGVIVVVGSGCELALDFDRTKIDGGSLDSSFGDTSTADQVTPPADTGSDSPEDSGADSPADSPAPVDTGTDTGKDAGQDAGQDSGTDADDSG